MRLSKESQILEFATGQLNRRLGNMLNQKIQVLETMKCEQRKDRERVMSQLRAKTEGYHHKIEGLQASCVRHRRKLELKKEQQSPSNCARNISTKLPPIQQHSSCNDRLVSILQEQEQKSQQRFNMLPKLNRKIE